MNPTVVCRVSFQEGALTIFSDQLHLDMTGVPDYIRNMKLELTLNGQLQALQADGGEGSTPEAYSASTTAAAPASIINLQEGRRGVTGTLPRRNGDSAVQSLENVSSVRVTGGSRMGVPNEPASQLEGAVDLVVALDLPGPLSFLPGAAIAAVGNSILQSILGVMYDSLMAGLVDDYNVWLEQSESVPLIKEKA